MRSFEEIPDIAERIKRSKMELQESGFYLAPEWDSQSCCDQDYVNNFKKGWESRQTEVDELTKQNAWLSDVACRENKRANKLQEEKVSTTTLLGKTIQEKNELQKQLIEQGQRLNVQTQQIASLKWQLKRLGYTDNGGELMKPPISDAPKFDLLDEMQKRVDELHTAFKQLIEMENESISFEHDLFDKGWNQSARQTIENIYKLAGLGEQALKGEGL